MTGGDGSPSSGTRASRARTVAVRSAQRALLWCVVALVLAWAVFPFWWGFASSIKPPAHLFDATLVPFLQFAPTPEHWQAEWEGAFAQDGMAWAIRDGTAAALGTAAVALVLGLLAAVGLSRFRRGGLAAVPLVALFLLPRLLPPVVTYLPTFLIVRDLGLADTPLALVLVDATLALPLAILVLHSAVRELPRDLLEAARLDGTSNWGLLWRFVVPLTRPALLAVGLLCFVLSWNEYLFALTSHGQHTITPPVVVALLEDRDGVPFEHVGSHLTLIIVPPLVLALLAQRYVVRGLTLGALRG